MKSQLLAITLCVFLFLSQASAAKNRTTKARQINKENVELQLDTPIVIPELNNNSWRVLYETPSTFSNVYMCQFGNVEEAIGNNMDALVSNVVLPTYNMIQNSEDFNLYAKVLLAFIFCTVIFKLGNTSSTNDSEVNKNEILSQQILDLSERVDRLLSKSAVDDITITSTINGITEKLDILTQSLTKTEANVQTLTTKQPKFEEYIHKFKQEVLDTQSTIIKELHSLKKIVAIKPPTDKSPPKRLVTTELSATGELNIDTSSTTPLINSVMSQVPFSAATVRKPSNFRVSVTKNSNELNTKESDDGSASPVSVLIPLRGTSGMALSEILSPSKGLKNPFEASRMASSKSKENVIQLFS